MSNSAIYYLLCHPMKKGKSRQTMMNPKRRIQGTSFIYTFNSEQSAHFPVWTEPLKMGFGKTFRRWTCNIAFSPEHANFSTSTLVIQYSSQHMQSEEDLMPTTTQSQPPRLRCAAPAVFTPSETALHRPTSQTICHSLLDKRSRRKNGASQRGSVDTLNKKDGASFMRGSVQKKSSVSNIW
ncbi:hypothetical protein GGP41_008770 [Bipolaris sorokiniana]|uniref:Uncharacterized protein n=1 Tax=Cochliobolus sativus TaxID=45130 RepID=A0A8H5ZB60_COCSA|nr:hypothetical protein GGP41_008770 [Bipolaris sorokiniana]